MADISYDDLGDGTAVGAGAEPGRNRLKRMTNAAGAAISVALMIGLTIWAYQLAVRDANGVPVVRALAGPMRVAPTEPGGVQMAHQGLAVNNVAALGEVAAPADRLVLAPKPVELSADDTAGYAPTPASAVVPGLTSTIPIPGQFPEEGSSNAALEGDVAAIETEPLPVPDASLAAPAAPVGDLSVASVVAPDAVVGPDTVVAPDAAVAAAPALPVAETGSGAIMAPTALAALPPAGGAAGALALAEELSADAAPLGGPDAAPSAPGVIAADVPGVSKSMRPAARPKSREVAAAVEPTAAPAADAATDVAAASVDAAALVAGTRLVQLGAFDDEAGASAEWGKLQTRFAAYFENKSPVIQQAASGGRTFFRLRAYGFADEDEARRFCSVLLNEQAPCIPVLIR